ncbi:hypothetical protein IWZ01DRAFT_336451 [Phyllosticta capitalensis]
MDSLYPFASIQFIYTEKPTSLINASLSCFVYTAVCTVTIEQNACLLAPFVWRIYIDHTVLLPFVCSTLLVAVFVVLRGVYTKCNVVGCCHAQFHANANAIRAWVRACLTRDEKGKNRGK